jgi:hypothetical protein
MVAVALTYGLIPAGGRHGGHPDPAGVAGRVS